MGLNWFRLGRTAIKCVQQLDSRLLKNEPKRNKPTTTSKALPLSAWLPEKATLLSRS